MKSTEFRRLNYVTDQFGEVTQIESISETEIFSKEIGEIPIYCVLPIPLTEDILLKCGFEKKSMGLIIKLNEHTLLQLSICNDKGKGEYYAMISQDHDIISIPRRVFELHELQNLYRILKGEELTVNL